MIKEYVDDGYSGAYLERPALESMREALRSGLFQAVVCYDVDRLSRNLSHQLIITEDIEKSGATLHFVKSNYESTPEGRMFYAIKGAFAGYEREKIRERTARGRLAMLQQGKVVQDSHVYGYDFDKEEHAYFINQGEARTIRKIFSLYLSGHGGISAICRWLDENVDEYPPPKGTAWSKSTIHDILRQEMYTGKYYSNRIYHFRLPNKKEEKRIRPQEEWIEMRCPAIIGEEEHQEALRLLKRNKTYDFHTNRTPTLLQGMVYCGKCGHMLHVRNGGTKNGTRWYMCWRNNNQGRSEPGCGVRSMQCSAVDNAFWELLKQVCRDRDTLAKYMKLGEPPPLKDREAKRKRKIEKIKRERKSVMMWYSKQLLTYEEATEKLEALKKAEDKLLKQDIPTIPIQPQRDLQQLVDDVMNCEPTIEAKRALVLKVVDKVVLLRTDNKTGVKNYVLDMQISFR
jgi:site-specific DNA recombinase